jgi:pyruvate/2-oxoglutarate/acetoin dehydrogenase E1 component
MDWAAIARSVVKTGRLLVAEMGPLTGGVGAEIVARVQEVAWKALKGPAGRVAGRDVPIAYNRRLENAAVPDAQHIATVARRMLRG